MKYRRAKTEEEKRWCRTDSYL